jgi:hypothetical protein
MAMAGTLAGTGELMADVEAKYVRAERALRALTEEMR